MSFLFPVRPRQRGSSTRRRAVQSSAPSPRKSAKKGVKKEKGIKAEPESASKRPRAISGKVSTTKRPNTTTRQQAKVLEEDLQEMLQGVEGLGGGAGDD